MCLGLVCLAIAFWKLQLFDPPTRRLLAVDPGGADLFAEVLPLAREATRQWLDGAMPLWNPHQFAGRPLLAMPLVGGLYPLNLPYLFLPTPVAIEHSLLILS